MGTETSWNGYNDKIPRIESTIVDLQEKYSMLSSGEYEYGMHFKKLVVCDYDNAWLYLTNGENDRRLVGDAAGQVFINTDTDTVIIAFSRPNLFESLEESIANREKAIRNGEILLDVTGSSPEGIAMHEWGM